MICKQSVLGSLPDLEVGQAGIPISSTKSDVEKSMLENIQVQLNGEHCVWNAGGVGSTPTTQTMKTNE